MKKLLFAFALPIIFFSSSCKKYEEGPQISFISDVNRISQAWALVSETSSGTTTSYTIEESPESSTFATDGTGEATYTILGISTSLSFDWEFVDETQLKMTYSGLSGSTTLTITKLSSKELWLRESDGDVTKWSVIE
tara:strand:- start:65 stop:475 length:411 start_codon:yes stop_codon:yes gene_type:complete